MALLPISIVAINRGFRNKRPCSDFNIIVTIHKRWHCYMLFFILMLKFAPIEPVLLTSSMQGLVRGLGLDKMSGVTRFTSGDLGRVFTLVTNTAGRGL